MASSNVRTSSEALTNLQTDLSVLSKELHQTYELMYEYMTRLGEKWKDGKYDDFVKEFKPKIEKCDEIATRYEEWCKKVLQPAIERAHEAENINVGLDGGGFGTSGSGTGGSGTGGSGTGGSGTGGSGTGGSGAGGSGTGGSGTGGSGTGGSGTGGSGAGGSGIGGSGTGGSGTVVGSAFASAAGIGFAGGAGVAFASAAGVGNVGDGKSMKDKPNRKPVDEMTDEELLSECTPDQIEEYNRPNVPNKRKFLEDNVLVNRAREHGIETSSDSIPNLACQEAFGEDYIARDYQGKISNNKDYNILFSSGHTTNDKQSKSNSGGVKAGPYDFRGESVSSQSNTVKNGLVGYAKCEMGKRSYPDVNNMSNNEILLEAPDSLRPTAKEHLTDIDVRKSQEIASLTKNPKLVNPLNGIGPKYIEEKYNKETNNFIKGIGRGNNIRRSEGEIPPSRPKKSNATMLCEQLYKDEEIPKDKKVIGVPGTSEKDGHTTILTREQIKQFEEQRKLEANYGFGTSILGQKVGVQYKESTIESTTESTYYSDNAYVKCIMVDK